MMALVWDAAASASRMLLWLGLMSLIVPRLGARKGETPALSNAVEGAMIAALAAVSLWLSDQLNVVPFLLALALWKIGGRRIVRYEAFVRELGRFVWHRFSDLFYRPGTSCIKGPPEKADKESSCDQKPPQQSEARRLALGLVETLRRFGNWRQHLGPERIQHRWPIRRVALWLPGLGAALGALLVTLARATSEHPIQADEAYGLLQRQGWIAAELSWVGESVAATWLRVVSSSLPVVAIAAMPAAIIFSSAWLGAKIIRRLAPNSSLLAATLAAGILPAVAVGQGASISLSVLVATLLPWVSYSLIAPDSRRFTPLLLAALVALLHPLGGIMALIAMLVMGICVIGRTGRQTIRTIANAVLPILLINIGLLYSSGARSLDDIALLTAAASAPLSLPIWCGVLSLVVGSWLVVGRFRGCSPGQLAGGRGLGALLLIAAYLAGSLYGEQSFAFATYATPVLLTLAIAVCAADIGRIAGRQALPVTLSLLLASTIAFSCRFHSPHHSIDRNSIELVLRLVERHYAWRFTVVGSHSVLPAVAGVGWFVAGSEVREHFPAATYAFHPEYPDRMIGTEHAYILVTDAKTPENMELRLWLDELADAGVPVEFLTDDSQLDIEVYLIKRDLEAEERILKQWRQERR